MVALADIYLTIVNVSCAVSLVVKCNIFNRHFNKLTLLCGGLPGFNMALFFPPETQKQKHICIALLHTSAGLDLLMVTCATVAWCLLLLLYMKINHVARGKPHFLSPFSKCNFVQELQKEKNASVSPWIQPNLLATPHSVSAANHTVFMAYLFAGYPLTCSISTWFISIFLWWDRPFARATEKRNRKCQQWGFWFGEIQVIKGNFWNVSRWPV